MLKTKHRVFILLSITLAIGAASLVNQIAIYLNINPQDPLFFNESNTAIFKYHNGTEEKTLNLTVAELYGTWSNVVVTIDSENWFITTPEGYVSNTDRYPIFWLHVSNPLTSGLSFGITPGMSFNVTDPIGLIGPDNMNYTAIIDRKMVLWPTEPGLHGAQYSFLVTFYNASNNVAIAQGIYDSTCGLLFKLEGGSPYIQLDLQETTYPISRNRMMSWPWALGFSIGVVIVAYILMKKRWEFEEETIREITLLMTAGVAAGMVDIYVDVWLYA
ncbi:MAG: hypothetical protein ACTSYB_02335, partial [Candidatus Helarchaeota archaeon]